MGSRTSVLRAAIRWHVPGWRWTLLPVLALPLILTGMLASQWTAAVAARPWGVTIEWLPALGLDLSLSLDSLSLIFALLVAGIGALVFAYSVPYMAGEEGLGRYYASLLLFMLAMLGVVLAANLLLIFVFWELTSISSYLLIGFRHEEKESQESALQALLITGAGGLAMLAGFVLVGEVYGTYDLAAILARPELLRSDPRYAWALALILLGAFTKSAQFPFHIWLPNAMVAPTPISAYLHSATMVKAGIYLLARLSPVLGGTPAWQGSLLAIGTLTMLLGALSALRRRDLKAILAYTTISALGMIVTLLGLDSAEAAEAALVVLVAHALYKGALFLMTGIIDHETGTRDVGLLGGLASHMPQVAVLALLAALSMAGLPPTLGFIAKELDYACVWNWRAPATLLFVLANACQVTMAIVLGYRIFHSPPGGSWPHKPHASSWLMVLPMAVLALLSWLEGLLPGPLDSLIHSAVLLWYPKAQLHPLQLWHGFTWPLALSAVTIAAGVGLYWLWPRLLAVSSPAVPLSPTRVYDWTVHTGLPWCASRLTRILQNGSLRVYLIVILGTTILLAGGVLLRSGLWSAPVLSQEGYHWPELLMVGLLIAATLSVPLFDSRLGTIAALGAVGSMVTLIYIRFSAPDLALTQLVIETLTVILLLLAFHYLPPYFQAPVPKRQLAIELVVAGSVGALMAALVLVANGVQLAPSVADYYVAHSEELAHGRNIVNVIVADFRGFDTLGEITVLATAAFGLYALLKLRKS